VYHGPRTALPGYLHELGFAVPEQALKQGDAASESESDSDSEDEAEVTEEPLVDKDEAGQDLKDLKDKKDLKEKKEKVNAPDMADFLSELLFMPHKAVPAAGLINGACQ
jgi:hypothetical protein